MPRRRGMKASLEHNMHSGTYPGLQPVDEGWHVDNHPITASAV